MQVATGCERMRSCFVGVQAVDEEVEPDLADRHQARVVAPRRAVPASSSVEIARPARRRCTGDGCRAHRHRRCRCASSRTALEIERRHGRNHAQADAVLRAARARTAGISSPNSGASRWQWVSMKASHRRMMPERMHADRKRATVTPSSASTLCRRCTHAQARSSTAARPARPSGRGREPAARRCRTRRSRHDAAPSPRTAACRERWQPGRRSFALLLALCVGLGATGACSLAAQRAHQLTQKDIDAAVLRTLQTATLPSPAAQGRGHHPALGGAGGELRRREGHARSQDREARPQHGQGQAAGGRRGAGRSRSSAASAPAW